MLSPNEPLDHRIQLCIIVNSDLPDPKIDLGRNGNLRPLVHDELDVAGIVDFMDISDLQAAIYLDAERSAMPLVRPVDDRVMMWMRTGYESDHTRSLRYHMLQNSEAVRSRQWAWDGCRFPEDQIQLVSPTQTPTV
jgi:hypothetical protein